MNNNTAPDLSGSPFSTHGNLIDTVRACLSSKSHRDIYLWLQGDIQSFLPHEILLVSWGDPNLGFLQIDLISPLPGLRTETAVGCSMMPLLQELFGIWRENEYDLLSISRPEGFSLGNEDHNPVAAGFGKMRSALAHGIRDERGRYQCLYVALSQTVRPPAFAVDYMRVLMPLIDTALRQVTQYTPGAAVSVITTEQEPAPKSNPYGMTLRELEIMAWVSAGKTNEVIGVILNISPFTVKNHLKRIFQKLSVTNRAQAVSKL